MCATEPDRRKTDDYTVELGCSLRIVTATARVIECHTGLSLSSTAIEALREVQQAKPTCLMCSLGSSETPCSRHRVSGCLCSGGDGPTAFARSPWGLPLSSGWSRYVAEFVGLTQTGQRAPSCARRWLESGLNLRDRGEVNPGIRLTRRWDPFLRPPPCPSPPGWATCRPAGGLRSPDPLLRRDSERSGADRRVADILYRVSHLRSTASGNHPLRPSRFQPHHRHTCHRECDERRGSCSGASSHAPLPE